MKTQTELKTLKDLEHLRISQGRSIGKSDAKDVSSMLLRQEAIQWIENSTDQKHWLKFFNLTEEDLK